MAIISKKELFDFMDIVGDGIYTIKRKKGEIVVIRKEDNYTRRQIEEILKKKEGL